MYISFYIRYDAKLYKLNNNFIICKKINIKVKYLSPSKVKCIQYQPTNQLIRFKIHSPIILQ